MINTVTDLESVIYHLRRDRPQTYRRSIFPTQFLIIRTNQSLPLSRDKRFHVPHADYESHTLVIMAQLKYVTNTCVRCWYRRWQLLFTTFLLDQSFPPSKFPGLWHSDYFSLVNMWEILNWICISTEDSPQYPLSVSYAMMLCDTMCKYFSCVHTVVLFWTGITLWKSPKSLVPNLIRVGIC